MKTSGMQFETNFEGKRVFKVGVRDLLGAPVDAIVNPANSGLSHGGGLAAVISDEAGPDLDRQCEEIIKRVGKVAVTLAVPTGPGNLPYKGVIHAVGPRMGTGDELIKLQRTIINSMIVAERKGWRSIAFPAISTGMFRVPRGVCAEAFKTSVPLYWEDNPDSCVNLVWLCLTINDYPEFERVLRSLPG